MTMEKMKLTDVLIEVLSYSQVSHSKPCSSTPFHKLPLSSSSTFSNPKNYILMSNILTKEDQLRQNELQVFLNPRTILLSQPCELLVGDELVRVKFLEASAKLHLWCVHEVNRPSRSKFPTNRLWSNFSMFLSLYPLGILSFSTPSNTKSK